MNGMRGSRFSVLVALIVAALMVAPPAAILNDAALDPIGTASAVGEDDRIFVIGVVDMTVGTLNPNTYTMVAEGMIIFPLYSYLIQWDQAGENVIGDLAKDWWVSDDGLTWEFELVNTAYFVSYDPVSETMSRTQQVTSDDVKWSVDTLAAEDGSRLNSIWPEIDGTSIIENTWCDGPFHFGITITQPFVPFQDSLMTQPILPRYYWEGEDFVNFDNDPPIGSGPFCYMTQGLPDEGFAILGRNPYWHGEESYGWQLHVDQFVMQRFEETANCYDALVSTSEDHIDAMMGVDPDVFVNDLPSHYPDVIGFSQSNGFVYEYNLNQLTDANRKLFGGPLNAGENNQLLLNHTIKKAMSMAVDRDWIINDALNGYGEYTTTLVPSQNPMAHNYGEDGHDCMLDPGVTGPAVPDPFDTAAARDMLWEAGWRYVSAGGSELPKTDPVWQNAYPLYNASGDALSFRFYTLNTASLWENIANEMVEWAQDIGVELDLQLLSVSAMNTAWYAADYDVWLWDWVFSPYTEAASGVLVVLTTDAIGTDSDIYMSNPEFDALYDQAIVEMDFERRKEILYNMQDIAYLNRGCEALAYRDDMYGFNTDRWTNFGDLNNEYFLLPDVWPTWLCMQMEPNGPLEDDANAAPGIGAISITNNTDSGKAEVGTGVSFLATGISDDHENPADLNYTWIWDFGGEKSVNVGPSVDHTFTSDGVYTVTLVVKETAAVHDHEDYLSSYKTFDLTVYDMSNTAPHSVAMEMVPADPTAGETITYTASAVDDEEDELSYSWDFGDGYTAKGQSVEHAYGEDGDYTVTVFVDDHHYGLVDRPVPHEQLLGVGPNHPPTVSVPPYGELTWKTDQVFSVYANDLDPRDELVFTWDWGDGSDLSVTSTPSAEHYYNQEGDYLITVYADDQTGLDGHNVSNSNWVYIVKSGNIIPYIAEFYVDMDHVYVDQTVTFSATAADGDGEPMTFTFEFDDGTNAVEAFGATDPLELVECSVEKAYTEAGTYSVYLYVTDGDATATSEQILITVDENSAPIIATFSPAPYYDTDVLMTFNVVASDPDEDDLTYTWDWGDGESDVTDVGVMTHTFADSDTYTVEVTVDDGKGKSDSAQADVTVNWIPWIYPKLAPRTLDRDTEYTFTVSATDNDTDELTYMWDFGDGTDFVFGSTVTHTYTEINTFTRTVWVWDDFLQYRVTHNVSSQALVTVKDPAVDSPPDVEPLDDIYCVQGEEIEIWVYATDDKTEDLLYWWDFGDLSDEVGGAPPMYHTYVDADDYTLTVWVDDDSGIPENNVSVSCTVHVAEDMPPVADAGGDREVDEDVAVWFTGEASTDEFPIPSDGYAWTVTDWDGDHLFDTMTFEYTFAEPGEWSVELVVTDSIGQPSDPDVITVTVLDVTPPVNVNAGPDQEVHNGTTVEFAGSAEDNYDEDLTFEWEFLYDGNLETLTGATPTWTFEILYVYTVTLTVTDDAGNFDEDNVIITVTDMVDPVADAGDDQVAAEGDTVTFDGSGSTDLDSSIVNYTWEFEYDGSTEYLYGADPTFVFEIEGEYTVTLTVRDEYDNEASDIVLITVEAAPVNEPPVADAGPDATIDVGDEYTFDGSGSSADVVNYTWTFTDGAEPVELWDVDPSYVFDTAGVYVVELNVTDDGGLWDTDTVTITVEEPSEENADPVADAGDDQEVDVGDTVTFDGSGSEDSDGTIVSYSWSFTYEGEPETLTGVSPSFEFETAGTYTVTLTVTDDDGATDTDTVTITVVAAEDEDEDDGGDSFLGTYGLPLAAVIVLLVVAVAAVMLMRKRKGGSGSVENTSPAEQPPEQP